MKDLYKSFVLKILAISFISAFFCLITNTGFSQWMQTGGPQGASVGKIVYNGTNILYAMTENFYYKSYNNGNSWTKLNPPFKGTSNIFANKSLVFAEAYSAGIYRSTNEGTNWDYVSIIGNTRLINSIAFFNDSVYISVTDGIYASPDKGTTWTFYPIQYITGLSNELFFVGNTMYSSCDISGNYVFVKSTDFGRSFSIIESNTIPKPVTSFVFGNGVFFSGFHNNGAPLYFKSIDSCKTWTSIPSLSEFPEVSLKYGNGKLYAYNSDTLYVSTDEGSTWTSVSSFNHPLNCIEFKGNRMFAGLYYPGVYRSTNGGYNWVTASNGMKEVSVTGMFTIGNYVYSGSGAGIQRTTGMNWQKYMGDLPDKTISAMYLDSNKLYAGMEGDLYRSTNNGMNWNLLYHGGYTRYVKCIYANQGNIYYGTLRNGLYISNDDGITWRVPTGVIGITSIEGLNEYVFQSTHNTHSAPSGRVYRSSDNGQTWLDVSIPNTPRPQTALLKKHNGNIFGISRNNLYKSTDFGLNWIKFQATFEDSTFTCMQSDNGILYCGTSTRSGKYYLRYSIDDGASFNKLGDSLPGEITDIAIKGNYLYAGVTNYSVWRISKSIITSGNNESGITPASFSLKQNYPNPFNPTTKIKYDVPRIGNVKIVVYDVMGRELQTLVNESLKPGTYDVSFDGSHYSSGVYFYKLITNGFTETRKMLLIK